MKGQNPSNCLDISIFVLVCLYVICDDSYTAKKCPHVEWFPCIFQHITSFETCKKWVSNASPNPREKCGFGGPLLTLSTDLKRHTAQSSGEGNPMCLKLIQNHINQSILMAIFQPQCMYCHLWEWPAEQTVLNVKRKKKRKEKNQLLIWLSEHNNEWHYFMNCTSSNACAPGAPSGFYSCWSLDNISIIRFLSLIVCCFYCCYFVLFFKKTHFTEKTALLL